VACSTDPCGPGPGMRRLFACMMPPLPIISLMCPCLMQPVDGNWSAWVNGTCSATCGGGTLVQTRTCDNPAPQNGGVPCAGSSTQTVACSTDPCGPGPGMRGHATLTHRVHLVQSHVLGIPYAALPRSWTSHSDSTLTMPRCRHFQRHPPTARSRRSTRLLCPASALT
jgi:hypothetical protein